MDNKKLMNCSNCGSEWIFTFKDESIGVMRTFCYACGEKWERDVQGAWRLIQEGEKRNE